jgi:hypothetical protein
MKTVIATAGLLLALLPAARSFALCGDVTGDQKRLASDALAVLRSAVGQNVDLICETGPTRLRFYNDFTCGSASSTAAARLNGFQFSADGGELSDYQDVDRVEIDTIEIDTCGGTYHFPGPIVLPPGRALTFYMALLDPEVYDFGSGVPALFVLYDDGDGTQMTTNGFASDAALRGALGGLSAY